jgi:hypothetical protein
LVSSVNQSPRTAHLKICATTLHAVHVSEFLVKQIRVSGKLKGISSTKYQCDVYQSYQIRGITCQVWNQRSSTNSQISNSTRLNLYVYLLPIMMGPAVTTT